MNGIITIILSAIIAIAGIWQSYTAKETNRAIFGLTPFGALLVVLAILGGVAGTLSAIEVYRVKLNPVIVSPGELSIVVSEFETITLFAVHNRSDNTVYSVLVKMSLETMPIFIQTTMTTDDGRSFVKIKGGEEFNADVLKIHAFDKEKRPVIYLLFRSLSPNETRLFKFKVKSQPNIQQNQKVKFRLGVIAYKREPYWFGIKGDTAALEFQIPEDFTLSFDDRFFTMLEKKPTNK